jgi:hypothetical protein
MNQRLTMTSYLTTFAAAKVKMSGGLLVTIRLYNFRFDRVFRLDILLFNFIPRFCRIVPVIPPAQPERKMACLTVKRIESDRTRIFQRRVDGHLSTTPATIGITQFLTLIGLGDG